MREREAQPASGIVSGGVRRGRARFVKRASLADVARAAGVGKATASRALSGDAHVGASTRARILATASELGYRPSQTARTLRTGRSGSIALAFGEPFPGAVIEGVFRECGRRGYRLVLESQTDPAQHPAMHAVDGRIIVDPDTRVVSGDVLTVVIDERRSDHDAVLVSTNVDAAVELALSRLRHAGARSCAVIGGAGAAALGNDGVVAALPAGPDVGVAALPAGTDGVVAVGAGAARRVPPGVPVVLVDLTGSDTGNGARDVVPRPLLTLGIVAARLVLDALTTAQEPAARTLCAPAPMWT